MDEYSAQDRAEQRERLKKIFAILKKRKISQNMIADQYGQDGAFVSNLLNGKIKNIPDSFLEFLKEYHVNPDYIRLESDIPFNYLGEQYEAFTKIFPKWTTVEHFGKQYLQLTMDSNFYNFLMDIDNVKLFNESGSIDIEMEIENLKSIHLGDPQNSEFVIIPCTDSLEIISEVKKQRKSLAEVVDFWETLE